MTQQEEIVAAARKYLGARWQHQARGENTMDCLGLVIRAVKEFGSLDWKIPDDYDRNASPDVMLAVCRKYLIEIPRADLQPGDMPILRYPTTNHVGIIGDYPIPGHLSIIHAQASYPHKVVENRFCEDWIRMVRATVVTGFRFPEKVA